MGVVSRRLMRVESMGVASGCGCKELYRFPHISLLLLYIYIYMLCSFCSSILTFCSLKKMFFVL